jgi:hypothetical protein
MRINLYSVPSNAEEEPRERVQFVEDQLPVDSMTFTCTRVDETWDKRD